MQQYNTIIMIFNIPCVFMPQLGSSSGWDATFSESYNCHNKLIMISPMKFNYCEIENEYTFRNLRHIVFFIIKFMFRNIHDIILVVYPYFVI